MKFKFCGNIDCPEWLITEITYLNKINAVKLRIISNNVSTAMAGGNKTYDQSIKMLEEMNFSKEESNVIVGVLYFIIRSSVKFEVDSVVLNQELQQLGLPQENADSIAKVYKNNIKTLKAKLIEETFTQETLKLGNEVKNKDIDWKVNYVLADKNTDFKKNIFEKMNEEEDTGVKMSKLETKIDIKLKDKVFTTNKEVLGKLINDLERANAIIKKYNNN
mmetsp:Transcript_58/g.50  ORF Transcript_58/g.50 Transcript_58/m.50 type:complete len:219 (+) Transcript_58:1-657(+)